MKKINKFNIISLVFIFISLFSISFVRADISYRYNVKENELYTFKIAYFDEASSYNYLGDNDIESILGENAEIGSMKARKMIESQETNEINTLEGNETGWECKFLFWDNWTANEEDFNDENNAWNVTMWILKNISTMTNNATNIEYFLYSGFPTPVNEYITDINLADNFETRKNQIIENTTVKDDVEYHYFFNENDGYLSKIQCKTKNGDLIYEITRIGGRTSPDVYSLVITFGVLGASGIGTLVILKKRKSSKL